jgi:hypothetical protein
MVFNGYNCQLTKNTDIEKVSVRAINAYFRQNLDQVYLAIVTVKGDEASFTIL